jgi:hypothetical protein
MINNSIMESITTCEIIELTKMISSVQLSSSKLLTLLTLTPIDLCTPEQSMQMVVPWSMQAHSGFGAQQSAHALFPGTACRRATWSPVRIISIYSKQ